MRPYTMHPPFFLFCIESTSRTIKSHQHVLQEPVVEQQQLNDHTGHVLFSDSKLLCQEFNFVTAKAYKIFFSTKFFSQFTVCECRYHPSL